MDLKISQLPELTSGQEASDDVFPVVDTSGVQTKKYSFASFDLKYASAAVIAALQAQADQTDIDVAALQGQVDGIEGDLNTAESAITALQAANGSGAISPTLATIGNNQTSQSITGLVFNKLTTKAAFISLSTYRKTDSNQALCSRELAAHHNAAADTWELVEIGGGGTLDDGMTFSINSSGQVLYSNDLLVGANYAGRVLFSARTLGVFGI